MTSKIGWEFPVDNADQWEGFNHPGIEHFRTSPLTSLAREVLQNSMDASVRKPVIVSFKYRDVPLQEIPGLAELQSTIQECLLIADGEGKKAKDFFAGAQRLLKAKSVPVLSVSEKNTKGMRGPCKNGSPYYSYVKATGQSKKDNDSGEVGLGSFGIGKFAPFANSNLRTIFVSTVFMAKIGSHTQYIQGKALLMSHKDGSGETRQNIGYWGIRQNCMPIEGVDPKLPGWLQQANKPGDLGKSLGTTVHVIGFQASSDWENKLTASVIENFFGAIWKGALVVEVGATRISRETLAELFESKAVRDSLEGMTGQPENFDNSKCFFFYLRRYRGSVHPGPGEQGTWKLRNAYSLK